VVFTTVSRYVTVVPVQAALRPSSMKYPAIVAGLFCIHLSHAVRSRQLVSSLVRGALNVATQLLTTTVTETTRLVLSVHSK
jgi:hypothetical protein